jgi:hypothetical protein
MPTLKLREKMIYDQEKKIDRQEMLFAECDSAKIQAREVEIERRSSYQHGRAEEPMNSCSGARDIPLAPPNNSSQNRLSNE